MTDTTGNQPTSRNDSSRSGRSDRRGGPRDRNPRNSGRGDKNQNDQRGRQGRGGAHRAGRSGQGHGRYNDRAERPNRGDDRQDNAPKHNPADLRSANRPDRGRSPNIDDDVTGKELDKSVQRELGTLDEQNRTWVQKHLVMALRLLDDDPGLAFDHALAASRRGGRLGVVREAAGMTAYAAGKFSESLREFRTYRRISGDNAHLPEMVDAERALGRPDKALQLVEEAQLDKLPAVSRVELAMVVAGIHLDNNDATAAVAALEIPQLNPRRGFAYSPRLFSAYAEALGAAGRADESRKWSNLAGRAERALGLTVEPEPEILDLGEDDQDTPQVRARDVLQSSATDEPTATQGGDE